MFLSRIVSLLNVLRVYVEFIINKRVNGDTQTLKRHIRLSHYTCVWLVNKQRLIEEVKLYPVKEHFQFIPVVKYMRFLLRRLAGDVKIYKARLFMFLWLFKQVTNSYKELTNF